MDSHIYLTLMPDTLLADLWLYVSLKTFLFATKAILMHTGSTTMCYMNLQFTSYLLTYLLSMLASRNSDKL